jgi:hypothetical protein
MKSSQPLTRYHILLIVKVLYDIPQHGKHTTSSEDFVPAGFATHERLHITKSDMMYLRAREVQAQLIRLASEAHRKRVARLVTNHAVQDDQGFYALNRAGSHSADLSYSDFALFYVIDLALPQLPDDVQCLTTVSREDQDILLRDAAASRLASGLWWVKAQKELDVVQQ